MSHYLRRDGFWLVSASNDCPSDMERPNPLHPDHLAPAERIAELGQILALGLVRLHARKSSLLSAPRGDSFVDFVPDQSGHAATLTNGKAWR